MEVRRTIDYTMNGMTHEMMLDLEVWLECSLFDTIRNDPEVDNRHWVSKWLDIIDDVEKTRKEMFTDELNRSRGYE